MSGESTLELERLWWDSDEDTVAQDVTTMAALLEQRAADRRTWSAIYHRLTTGRDPASSYSFAMSRFGAYATNFDDFETPSINALAEVIESLTAHVGKNRPWILFSTDGAGLKQRVGAKKASKWIWRLFHKVGAYDTGRAAFAQGLRLGLGPVKVVFDEVRKEIVIEGVHLDECLWDEVEVAYSHDGKPYQFMHRRFVDRHELAARFPDKEEEIMTQAPAAHVGVVALGGLEANRYIPLVDAWRRPSPGREVGRHVIACGDILLKLEDWKKGIPMAFWSGVETLPGQLLGQGVAELGYAMQREVNRASALINEAERLVAGPWVLGDDRSNVQLERLTDLPGQKVTWNSDSGAQPPTVVTHKAVDASIYNERDKWVDRIRRRFGVSDMMTAGTKPAGITSGEGIRSLADQSTARHVVLGQNNERGYVDVAKLVLELAEEHDIAIDLGERLGGKTKWSELKVDGQPTALPLSSLPLQPEGQIQAAGEWLQQGIIDREMYVSIVNMPDSQRARDLITASRDNVEWMLDSIVDEGKYRQPEPYQDLGLLIRMAQERLLHEETVGTPDDRLDLIRQLIDEADRLRETQKPQSPAPQPGAQPAAAGPVAPGGPPLPAAGPPGAPPVAPLNPNLIAPGAVS